MTAGWGPVVGGLCSPSSHCLHFQLHHKRCWRDTVSFPPQLPCLSRMKPPERMTQAVQFLRNSYTVVTVVELVVFVINQGHVWAPPADFWSDCCCHLSSCAPAELSGSGKELWTPCSS